ncbi:Alpha/Beta hydrolase protein [Aspergillus granulosus]|uniref:Alpha/Beta hydrolase protein n=1 Tax=Aspergillus granulosus TaxID=176169 RepID=A0ABR4HQ97_9EURO
MKLTTIAASLLVTMTAASRPCRNIRFDDSKLAYYPAPEPNGLGVGVLVVPGGGYSHVSLEREGSNSTLYLNTRGYDAWVLNYSVAETAPTPLYPVPLEEALCAAQHIRRTQPKSKLTKLGIWGYSAGGHLAAVTVTNPEANLDFGILAYPVISMDEAITHEGSRTNLLGENPSPELVEKMSAENRVTADTPPIFLYHSANDATVPVENTLRFIGAMTKKSRPYQALILPDGAHGIALALNDPVRNWEGELDRFLTYSI